MAILGNPGAGRPKRRPSLSPQQIRDPLGTLAAAYGVSPDLSEVAAVVSQRLPADLVPGGSEALGVTVTAIVAAIVLDGRNLGRIYRGSPLVKPAQRAIKPSLDFYVGAGAAEQFLEMVCQEIRTSLG
jgi:hypothetical protein